MFTNNVLTKFVDTICIFFYTHSPYFVSHCTEYKLSALQVRISEENKINATTQQFITAKISGCALKQGSKTHSSLRQSNLQLQNEAALMSCRIRAVECRKCAPGLAGAHPGLQDRILLSTRIENAYKVRKKPFNFSFFIDVLLSIFPAETLSSSWMLQCLKKLFLSSYNSSIMRQKMVTWPLRSALALISCSRQNKDNFGWSELSWNTCVVDGGSAKSGEVVTQTKARIPTKTWLLLFGPFAMFLKFACKFIRWYFH